MTIYDDFNFDDIFTGFDLDFNMDEVHEEEETREINEVIEDDETLEKVNGNVTIVDMDNVPNREKGSKVKCRLHECNSMFSGNSSEKYHYDSVHLGIKFNCTLCDNKLASKRSLSRHMSAVHSVFVGVKERYGCTKCSMTFGARQSLSCHYEEQHTDIEFECGFDGCTRLFASRRRLAYHVKAHHVRGHQCSTCRRRFKAKFNLDKHIRNKHVVKN